MVMTDIAISFQMTEPWLFMSEPSWVGKPLRLIAI